MPDAPLNALIEIAAHLEGIDPELGRQLVKVESDNTANARSPKGALGYTQLMPGTAKGLGVDPRDPVQNLRGGFRYLKQQQDTFGSDELALAAYNAGPNAVKKYRGVPNFKETQAYIKKFKGVTGGGQGEAQAAVKDIEAAMAMKEIEAALGGQPSAPQQPVAAPESPGILNQIGNATKNLLPNRGPKTAGAAVVIRVRLEVLKMSDTLNNLNLLGQLPAPP